LQKAIATRVPYYSFWRNRLSAIYTEKGRMIDEILKQYSLDGTYGFEILQKYPWEQEGKIQIKQTIIKYKDRFFSIFEYRSGSPFSDWNYDDPTVVEVVPKEETITVTNYYSI
jgi:hypothetical protein